MDRGGWEASGLRHCVNCGRPLEPGESCECDRVAGPRGGTRDGLRARCPQFVARSSYRGKHYLDCGGHKLKACDLRARDALYALYCCGSAEARDKCPFLGHRGPALEIWDEISSFGEVPTGDRVSMQREKPQMREKIIFLHVQREEEPEI